MQRIYYYKLTADDGGAPCVQDGLLSLAICKPMIRNGARPGDVIFGFAANSLHRDNRLIYVAVLSANVYGSSYYNSDRYRYRGDCIYELRGDHFIRRRGALFHGNAGDLAHDLGRYPIYDRANTLLSTDFRYFGKDGTDKYKTLHPLIEDVVEALGQGHRVHHGAQLREQLFALKEQVWQATMPGEFGNPSSRPRRSVSHRSKSCGIA